MTVGCLVVRLRPLRLYLALIAVWKGGGHCEVLLSLIGVDLLTVEVWILRQHVSLNLLVDLLLDLVEWGLISH